MKQIQPEEILQQLVAFDTRNFDPSQSLEEPVIPGTEPALTHIEDILKQNGLRVKYQTYTISHGTAQTQRRNLVATIPGDEKLPAFGLQGHIDTVPFGHYAGRPLGECKGGRIHGRGAVDMKGSLASMIFAMTMLPHRENRKATFKLVVTSDEEAHAFAGIKAYLLAPESVELMICGEPSNGAVYDRFKGALYETISIGGRAGHSSHPYQGKNAIVRGAPVLAALSRLQKQVNKGLIRNTQFTSQEPYSDSSTMSIGKVSGGTKVNIIPDSMSIELEMRLVQDIETHNNLLDTCLQDYGSARRNRIFTYGPMVADLTQTPLAIRLAQKYPQRQVMFPLSEATLLNQAGTPAIVMGAGDPALQHCNDEYIKVSDLHSYAFDLLELIP